VRYLLFSECLQSDFVAPMGNRPETKRDTRMKTTLLLTFLDDQATDRQPSLPDQQHETAHVGYHIHHINDPNSLASPAGSPGGQEGSRGGRSE